MDSKVVLNFAAELSNLKVIKQLTVLTGFIALAIVLRFCSFFPSVINHDESTYLVIADTLTKGATYWIDYADTKPVGIFTLLALFQLLVGKSIFLFRLFTAVCVALSAFLLYLIQLECQQKARVGIASGIIYLIITSLYTFYGISPNTETFFNLFTLICLYLILRRRGGIEYLLAGLAIGYAFLIKYVVLFDVFAFGIFLLIEAFRQKQAWQQFVGRALLLSVGFLLPFGLFFAYYGSIGAADTAWFYTAVVSGRYPKSPDWIHYIKYPSDFFLRFLPVSIFFFYGLWSKKTRPELVQLGSIWAGFSFIAVLAPGIPYGHYFIQFMLPFAFVAGWIFGWEKEDLPKWIRYIFRPKIGYSILGVLLSVNLFFQYKDYIEKPDYPRMAAQYLEERLAEDETIYTGNSSHIIYYLLDKTPPNKYVHPSLFWTDRHIQALEIDVAAEITKIKESQPKFVLLRSTWRDDRLEDWMAENYTLVKTFGKDKIKVFERK